MDASRPISLVGGGEHAAVVADVVAQLGLRLAGCWAPVCEPGMVRLGDDVDLERLIRSGEPLPFLHLALAGKAGSGIRQRVVERLKPDEPLPWITLCHPAAIVSPLASLDRGCFLAARAVVNPGAVIRRHVIVNTGAVVEHDVVVEDGAHLCPGCVTGGKARIGAWATVGLGALIRDHVSVGAGAVVGMGAVVVRDVPDGAWVVGNPARLMVR